jgi:hypothetical protein
VFATTDMERVLKPDAHRTAEHGGLGGERHLEAAGGQHRPAIVRTEQFVGLLFHEGEIVHVGADAAENAKDHLDEERRFHQATIDEVRQAVETADIVAFTLEPGPVAFAQQLQDALDIAKSVAVDEVVGAAPIGFFPVVFPGRIAVGERIDAENSSSPC